MEVLEVGKHMVVDPGICHGKLTFKGTRVPVNTVLTFLAKGDSIDEIMEGWPELKREAVEEAIKLAAVAWPELLREPVEKAIIKLAAPLQKRRIARAKARHEPARSGQSA